MKTFKALLSALVVLIATSAASAAMDANQGDLLSEFSTAGAEFVAPMSLAELGDVRGEGTFTTTFDFPKLHHDFDQTFTFQATTIHVIGVAATGQITVTIDSPYIP